MAAMMKVLSVATSVLAVTIASVARVPAAQTTKPTAPAAVQNDEELAREGEQLVNKACNTACHGLEKLDEMRRPARDWSNQVGEMALKGAVGTDAQFATIKKYLTRYYGVVEVNTATAEELSAVMGFSTKDAQAIVAYRTANGKFADAAALSKVPGIDKSKIEEQPEALRFK
jgi:competence ComEA-like helix-hairpin-helix protein